MECHWDGFQSCTRTVKQQFSTILEKYGGGFSMCTPSLQLWMHVNSYWTIQLVGKNLRNLCCNYLYDVCIVICLLSPALPLAFRESCADSKYCKSNVLACFYWQILKAFIQCQKILKSFIRCQVSTSRLCLHLRYGVSQLRAKEGPITTQWTSKGSSLCCKNICLPLGQGRTCSDLASCTIR